MTSVLYTQAERAALTDRPLERRLGGLDLFRNRADVM